MTTPERFEQQVERIRQDACDIVARRGGLPLVELLDLLKALGFDGPMISRALARSLTRYELLLDKNHTVIDNRAPR